MRAAHPVQPAPPPRSPPAPCPPADLGKSPARWSSPCGEQEHHQPSLTAAQAQKHRNTPSVSRAVCGALCRLELLLLRLCIGGHADWSTMQFLFKKQGTSTGTSAKYGVLSDMHHH
eukprot:1154873-Pelagomonas_calceolata.AAC.3